MVLLREIKGKGNIMNRKIRICPQCGNESLVFGGVKSDGSFARCECVNCGWKVKYENGTLMDTGKIKV